MLLLLLHVEKSYDIQAPDYPLNRLLADLRQGAESGEVLLLLHDVYKAGAADVHADCPFNKLTDLRQGAGSSEAACGAAAA